MGKVERSLGRYLLLTGSPPDYVDVNAKTKDGKWVQVYYSPACGNLCMTDLDQKLAISDELIDYWLKEVE